jgi:hypothetical protein
MCSNARNFLRILFGTVLVSGVVSGVASAQSKDRVEVAVNYAASRASSIAGGFWMQGGSAQLDAPLWRHLGVAADVTGLHVANINGSGTGLDIVATTFGPRYAWKLSMHGGSGITLFAHGLIGDAHGMHGVFPSQFGANADALAFATKAGGGVEFNLRHHFAVRAIEADWLRTQFPNAGTNAQNMFEVSSGLVVRF